MLSFNGYRMGSKSSGIRKGNKLSFGLEVIPAVPINRFSIQGFNQSQLENIWGKVPLH